MFVFVYVFHLKISLRGQWTVDFCHLTIDYSAFELNFADFIGAARRETELSQSKQCEWWHLICSQQPADTTVLLISRVVWILLYLTVITINKTLEQEVVKQISGGTGGSSLTMKALLTAVNLLWSTAGLSLMKVLYPHAAFLPGCD